jgi:hypothetical protein
MKNTHIFKKKITIIVITACVIIGGYIFIAWLNHLHPFSNVDSTPTPGTQFINMDKTKTEKQSSDNLKNNPQDKLKNSQTDTPPAPSVSSTTGKQQANVLITNVGISNGTVSASGFVTNIVESDGSCDYIFVNGNHTISKPSKVLPNATSTTCSTVTFPTSDLPISGTWSVTLSYSSAESSGVSTATSLQK